MHSSLEKITFNINEKASMSDKFNLQSLRKLTFLEIKRVDFKKLKEIFTFVIQWNLYLLFLSQKMLYAQAIKNH